MKTKIKEILHWLNSGDRWHDLAHTLFGYFIVSLLGSLTGIWWLGLALLGIYCGVKEFILDSWEGWDNFHDILQYLVGAGIAVLTLLI